MSDSIGAANGVSDNGSCSHATTTANLGASTPKSVSIPSGSRSEIHYPNDPNVQNPTRIYDGMKNRKIVRIFTVICYIFAVSLAAIVLSFYYVFLWDPDMQIKNSTNTSVSIEMPYMASEMHHLEDNENQSGVVRNESTFMPPSAQTTIANRNTITKMTSPATINVLSTYNPLNANRMAIILPAYSKRQTRDNLVSQSKRANSSHDIDTSADSEIITQEIDAILVRDIISNNFDTDNENQTKITSNSSNVNENQMPSKASQD